MEPEMPPRLQDFKNRQKTKAKATGRQCLLVTKDWKSETCQDVFPSWVPSKDSSLERWNLGRTSTVGLTSRRTTSGLDCFILQEYCYTNLQPVPKQLFDWTARSTQIDFWPRTSLLLKKPSYLVFRLRVCSEWFFPSNLLVWRDIQCNNQITKIQLHDCSKLL